MRSKARGVGAVRSAADVGERSSTASHEPHGHEGATDLAGRRARRRRMVMTVVFAAVLGLGIVGLLTNPTNSFPLFGIALIALGGINCAINAAALWRMVDEQRTQEAVRRDFASEPLNARAFDQTNGVVDLGEDAQRAGSNEENDRARRLSSMNAAGIAYGNGTR